MDRLFFSDESLVAAWDAAVAPNAADRLQALTELAANADRLPGAVFFERPAGEPASKEWDEVLKSAAPLCKCYTRWLLVPKTGRSRFAAYDSPQQVVVTEDSPLYIAPRGGDYESTFIRFEVRGNLLIGRGSPVGEQPTYEGEALPFLALLGPRPNEVEFPLYELQTVVERHGENICKQMVGRVSYPVCTVFKVQGGREGWKVSFELDASVTQVSPAPLHVCACPNV